MNIFPIFIGGCLIADGIGSIAMQPKQSFFWWQAVRIARTIAGVALIAYGIFFT